MLIKFRGIFNNINMENTNGEKIQFNLSLNY